MHLIYLDESGNTGIRKDPDQPIHLIAGLCVREADIRPIEDAVRAIVRQHFGVLILSPGFEVHAVDLYSGNGFFKGVAPATRIACIHDILDALAANNAAVIWAAVDKIKLYSGRHPHQLAFLLLIERIEDRLRSETALGLLVADENKEIEQRLIDDLELYKSSNTAMGWRATHIASIFDSIHFVQSVNNRLIQCVDIIAYFALKAYRQETRLLTQFLILPDPKPAWTTWRAATFTQKTAAIHAIGQKIDAITVNRKVFPT